MSIHGHRKSFICTPATSIGRYAAARSCGADVGLVDLEDSVPLADKQAGRSAAEGYFNAGRDSACALAVRINSLGSPEGLRDLLAVMTYVHRPAIVLIPKVESARDIDIVASVLSGDNYAPELYAIIETPRGIRDLASIVQASRLGGLVFGAADYALNVGCTLRWSSLAWARSAIVTAASYVDIPVIDSPYFQIDDFEGLRREARLAKEIGFRGKIALHPLQVPVINLAFTPSDAEIDQARAIVAAGERTGTGVATVDGQMVGPPFFAAARNIVDLVDTDGAASLGVGDPQR